ncbi:MULTISPECIES: WXG100 family type VII secretion target [Microbacterium]|uniref:WXG100 family type VII secretion target n=1 Tax=Microbacterium TaxID=33882 RepID=UPI00217D344D|nr:MULTISPECIES: WXG100 family type VII secretion target [Microbacterium]UWF77046.1 WXG100 family type VII secretion target [Microbacterium neungamense]WCM55206.1 WXG100 family type VII secretion target [Microbacterium sp. EF45047]
MTVFTVDTDAVDAAHGAVLGTMSRLQTESGTLMSQLTQLQSAWTGPASAAFQECSEQWRAAQLHVEQVLGSIGGALATAAMQYAEADQYSASLFR